LFIADIILERNKDEKKGVEVRREWGGGGGSRRDGGERGGEFGGRGNNIRIKALFLTLFSYISI